MTIHKILTNKVLTNCMSVSCEYHTLSWSLTRTCLTVGIRIEYMVVWAILTYVGLCGLSAFHFLYLLKMSGSSLLVYTLLNLARDGGVGLSICFSFLSVNYINLYAYA